MKPFDSEVSGRLQVTWNFESPLAEAILVKGDFSKAKLDFDSPVIIINFLRIRFS